MTSSVKDESAAVGEDVSRADGGFRKPVLRGLAWQSATRGTFEVSKLVVAVVLAHLLSTHQYGIAGMVLVVVGFEPVLAGGALASIVVQRHEITEEERSTVFWTVTGLGLLVFLIGVAVSGLVASFYGTPEVQPLFAAISLIFLLSSLSQVQNAILIRQMDFKSLELRSMAGMAAGSVAAIVVAADGGGPWAFVAQQIGAYGVATALLWHFSDWRPRLMYSRKALRGMLAFGTNVSGSMVMFQLTQNTDNVLIGRYLGAEQLGLYALAYNIILVPVSRVTAPLVSVLYPVFSRVQDDLVRLSGLWLRVLRLTSALAVPAILVLIVVAPDMVEVVFGRKWHGMTPVIQILASVGLLYGLQGLNAAVLQAINSTTVLFRYSCVSFGAALASFVVGLHWGIVGVSACFAGVSWLIQPFYMHLTARAVGIGLRECGRALSGVFQAAVVTTAVAAVVRGILVSDGTSPAVRLVGVAFVAALVYLPVCAWRAPEVRDEVQQILRQSSRRL